MRYDKTLYARDPSKPPCDGCNGACCRQNGHDYAVLLSTREAKREPFKSVAIEVDDGTGRTSHAIPYRDKKCAFLKDGKCSIYEDRPSNCRGFSCAVVGNRGPAEDCKPVLSYFLEDNPKVCKLVVERGYFTPRLVDLLKQVHSPLY